MDIIGGSDYAITAHNTKTQAELGWSVSPWEMRVREIVACYLGSYFGLSGLEAANATLAFNCFLDGHGMMIRPHGDVFPEDYENADFSELDRMIAEYRHLADQTRGQDDDRTKRRARQKRFRRKAGNEVIGRPVLD